MERPVVIVGAGMGGLAAALDLAVAGYPVHVYEQAATVGGKMAQARVGGVDIDVGPTVLTLRHVFDALFDAAGASLDAHVPLERLPCLARHAWDAQTRLDLWACPRAAADAVGAVFGLQARGGYVRFMAYAAALYEEVRAPFLYAARPSFWQTVTAYGPRALGALWRIDARRSMMAALREFFPRTPQLQQLFGRYATYCGGSPYEAPATVNLVAHVEALGVYGVAGGMHALARAVAGLAERHGVQFRCGVRVERLLLDARGAARGVELAGGEVVESPAVVLAGDVGAFERGLLGIAPIRDTAPRGLSAVTWALQGRVEGWALARHNVLFGPSSAAEFDAVFSRRTLPAAPTLYVCAQDRRGPTDPVPGGRESLFCLINAPPRRQALTQEELDACHMSLMQRLQATGLTLVPATPPAMATPADFAQRFPGTDGALYGKPPHGWRSFFNRPGSRSRIPGVFFAGGSVHPGPGMPLAALSGRLAAAALRADFPSTWTFRRVGTPGGMSTRRATTDAMASAP